MILYTSHSVDFDIVNDLVDLNKSPTLEPINERDDIFQKAYEWLFKKLKYDKYIWAYNTFNNVNANHGTELVRWTLDVPIDECIAINSDVWNCVINNWSYIKELWDNTTVISDEEYDKLEMKYLPIKEQTWESIFDIPKDSPDAEILIKSPINEKYVINKEWICDYDNEFFDSGIVNSSFKDMKRLEIYRNIVESGLKGRKIDFNTSIKSYENSYFGLRIDWCSDK